MIDREMVEEENKDEKIRHENSSGCMHGNDLYQSVYPDRTGGIEEEIVGEAASWYLVVYCFCFGFCRLC